jgi:hypothetical protein
MSAHYYFQDFDRLQHSEFFLRDHIQEIVDLFIPDKRYTLMARVRTIRARKTFREPIFLCEVQLDAPQNSTSIIIKKTDSDFYHAALQVAHALKKVLRCSVPANRRQFS